MKDDFGRMEMRNDGGDKYKGRKFEEHAEKTMQNFVFPTRINNRTRARISFKQTASVIAHADSLHDYTFADRQGSLVVAHHL